MKLGGVDASISTLESVLTVLFFENVAGDSRGDRRGDPQCML